jgi:NDP-sugar pyrophosphorylase family protein
MLSRALILAAGIGSRLRPMTDHTPKALLKYQGKTMLEHVISQVAASGIDEIVINVHHHADQVIDFVRKNDDFGLNIKFSDERELLMDTGGAILKAKSFLDKQDPFLVHNIDIYSDIDLNNLYEAHLSNNSLATLAVRNRHTSRNLLVDSEHELCGWKNNQSGETIIVKDKPDLHGVAFSGIHIIDPEIFTLIHDLKPFSIIDTYLDLAKNHRISCHDHTNDIWIDMAHPDNFS